MSLYTNLLFLQGHIADPRLAVALSASDAAPVPSAHHEPRAASGQPAQQWRHPMDLFKSLLYLGGLESIDLRVGEEEETYGRTYGNRVASERAFGKPAAKAFHRRVAPLARGNAEVGDASAVGCVAGGCG